MATLHMVFSVNSDALHSLPDMIQPGDAVLLGSDGCYLYSEFRDLLPCHLLLKDAADRGISLKEPVSLLSDEAWYDLVFGFDRQVTWP